MLSDVLSDSTAANITACTGDADLTDGLTIVAGGSSVCNYTAVLSYDALSKAPKNNTATATLNGVDFSASDPIEWAANVIRGSVTLDDDQNPAWPVTITNGGTWTYPDNYTCSIETGLYEGDGTYSFTDDNLATVKFGDTVLDEDSASSVVNCYNPSVSKTAVGGYVRTYKWLIDKSVDKGVEEPVTVFVGEAVDFNYTVKVTPNGYTDHDYVVTGEIAVVNPHPTEAITVDVTDEVDIETVTCTVVDGVDAIVPANSSKVFTYTCVGDDLPMVTENSVFANWTAYSSENTVTGFASATVDVIFPGTPASEEFKKVEVYDDKTIITDPPSGELLGSVTWNSDGTPTFFTYTLKKVAPYGCATYTNTAWIEKTDQSDSVTIEICGEYWAFTPGFWKNHTEAAPSGNDAWQYTGYSPEENLGEIFGADYLVGKPRGELKPLSQFTLLQALSFKGGPGVPGATQILLRAGVAALLNASFHETLDVEGHPKATIDAEGRLINPDNGSVYYPLSVDKVIFVINEALASNDAQTILDLAALLDGYNNGIHYIDWDWVVP
jgi:hypothetical protein